MKIFGQSFHKAGDNLYVTQDNLSFTYSDGDENERKLLKVTNSAQDLSSLSLELHQNGESWIDRYHFSMHRGSIIRCLPFSRHARVLEIGAGCGAVTRALAEKFAQVDAIEGSLNRARICSSRCRDLENVRVFASEINTIEPEPNYDLVILVGVLEWSSGFVEGIDPFRKCLQIASQSLVEDGTIVIAIENQLGLKYFLGVGEDHSGREFEGLHGYPTFQLAETFSKLTLSEMLKASGLVALRFMYPFPDYKMARVVVTDEAVSLYSESIGYWVSRYPFEDYLQPERRTSGNRALITCEVAKAGLLGELANSFLILASRRESSLPTQPWMVWSERLARNRAL
jgi:SAM-dependent methyltransferase